MAIAWSPRTFTGAFHRIQAGSGTFQAIFLLRNDRAMMSIWSLLQWVADSGGVRFDDFGPPQPTTTRGADAAAA